MTVISNNSYRLRSLRIQENSHCKVLFLRGCRTPGFWLRDRPIGTNTYLIGLRKPYILVDAAEGLESYLPILTSALQGSNSTTTTTSSLSTPDISDVIISHWHYDHIGGLPSVLTLLKNLWVKRNQGRETEYQGPKLHKYPLDKLETKTGGGGEGHLGSHNKLPDIEKTLQKDSESKLYTAAPDGSVFHDLYDGQKFVTVDKGTTTATLLEVLHTPGHSADSICLYLPIDQALYTADTVLGHGTAVFEDLAEYMKSLNKMLRFNETRNQGEEGEEQKSMAYYGILYPGHGDVLTNGPETIATYIKHRMEREAQIVEVLRLPVPVEFQSSNTDDRQQQQQQLWTTWNLVRHIYKSYPENLWLPATRSVHLHLKKLEGDGIVRFVEGEGKDTMWELVAPAVPSSGSG